MPTSLSQARQRVIIRFLVIASFLTGTMLACLLILIKGPHWTPIAGGLLVFTAALWLALRSMERRGWNSRWLLSLSVLNALIVVPELALRTIDFRYESGVQFGYPKPSHFWEYTADPDLFWRMKPGPGVNSFGFTEAEFDIPKPNGERRILFLGGSCTQQGFPDLVERRFRSADGRHAECLNLAIAGYSSYQGRILAARYGEMLEPDLVFVYFGWNDHWLAFGAPDADKGDITGDLGLSYTADRLMGSRLVQALFRCRDTVLDATAPTPLDSVRVPIDSYRDNLRDIVETFRRRGVPVVLLTAPSNHPHAGVPQLLIDHGMTRSRTTAVRLHSEYNDVVRSFDGFAGCRVLDLARRFDELPDRRRTRLFMADGIHFTSSGLSLIAEIVAAEIPALSDRYLASPGT